MILLRGGMYWAWRCSCGKTVTHKRHESKHRNCQRYKEIQQEKKDYHASLLTKTLKKE